MIPVWLVSTIIYIIYIYKNFKNNGYINFGKVLSLGSATMLYLIYWILQLLWWME